MTEQPLRIRSGESTPWEVERDRFGVMFSGPLEVGECIEVVPLREAHAEIERLRQGLWDCAIAAGMDHDGDLTPKHLAHPDIVELALREVNELRRDYDEALGGGLA